MAAAKLSDEAFSAILEAHPGLRERFASIAMAVANSGKISRRPTRSKSGLSRKCGCWGERRCKDGPRRRWKRPRKKFVNNLRCIAKVKKTPLAYEIWRNRGFRAAISERDEARSPIHAQRKSCPSGMFTAAAARHRRLCRRSVFRFGADEVA